MSTQRKAEFSGGSVSNEPSSDDRVHDYLARHPDFFERHPRLLSSLRLPHASGGAVSLVERQVSVLRQKDLKHERKLKELLKVARANDAISGKIHRLTLRLLAVNSLQDTLLAIEEALRAEFDADQSILVLFGDLAEHGKVRVGRFFRPVERDDPRLKAFDTFLAGTGPRCGQVRDAQRDFLFGRETDEVGSAALIPLGKKAELGFMAIGSTDSQRFHPGMSIDFLGRLGELIAEALKRF